MTDPTLTIPGGRLTPGAAQRGPQRHSLANLGAMIAFNLRFNWLRLVIWLGLTTGMIGAIAVYYAEQPLEVQLERVLLGDSTALRALFGWLSTADTPNVALGGLVWLEIWVFEAIMFGIGLVMLVTHNLRANEDSGRTEIFRARPLGLHSSLAATLVMTIGLVVVVGVTTGLTGLALKFGVPVIDQGAPDDALGSWVFGLSVAGPGLFGVAVGALTNQLMASSRAANGVGVGVFGLCFLLRAAVDGGQEWLVWVSPLSWAQRMDPWGDNRLELVIPLVVVSLVLIGVAWLLETGRDHGGSLVPDRLGSADAKPSMTTVWGLAWHQQRVVAWAWLAACVVFAGLFGNLTTQAADMIGDMGLAGADASSMLSLIGFMMSLFAMVVASYTLFSATTLPLEESQGYLEHQLSGVVSRLGWALGRLAVTLIGSVVMLAVTGVVYTLSYCASNDDYSDFWPILASVAGYLPSVVVMMGLVVLGFGFWPRRSVVVGWGLYGTMWLIILLGEMLRIPDDVLLWLPFLSAANSPASAPDWTKLTVTMVVGVGMVVAGLIGFRRRRVPA